jgi:predicted Zn finger-like uncharacterized protein
MPIQVHCPSCGANFRVSEELAGKRGRCARCKAVFSVARPRTAGVDLGSGPAQAGRCDEADLPRIEPRPKVDGEDDDSSYALADGAAKKAKAVRAAASALPGVGISAKGVIEAAAPTRRTLTPKQIMGAFRGEIEPFRPTFLYRLWVVIVVGVMVLLPLIYVGIIGLTAAVVVYHAVNHATILNAAGRGGAIRLAALVYLAPIVVGGVVVALLLKPLFAQPGRGPKQKLLEPGAEPLLYAFVDGVCAAVGAPRPARVAVDCQVNASAHRDGGFLGLFGGDLVLTIGLPIVAGLSLTEFAGVLAHEFGHFSQGAGTRLYSLITRVNRWFARVVYERDEWDETFVAWSSDDNGLIMVLGGLTRLAIWLTRRVLWVLMQVGHLASGFLLRQMEFDADRYEARMVSGRTFATTMQRIRLIGLAEQGAQADVWSSWQQRRLPDNYPKLVMTNIPQIHESLIAVSRMASETRRTGLFDTHPADKDRIARARREEPGPGIFHLDGPATDVFRDFDTLAKSATFAMYKSMLRLAITKDQLFEVAELVETQTAAQEGAAACDRFFLGAWDMTQRIPLPQEYPTAPGNLSDSKSALVQARRDLQAAREPWLEARRRDDEVQKRLYFTNVALLCAKTGVPFDPADFELKTATPRAIESARERAEAAVHELAAAGEPFAAAAARRLTQALALLEAEPVAARVTEGLARREEAHALYRCAAHLGANVIPQIGLLFQARTLLSGTASAFEAAKGPTNEPRINAILRAAAALRDRLVETRWKVGDFLDYPFEHADDNVTLGKFIFPSLLPEKNDVGGLLQTSDEALDRLAGLYRRALGRLAVTVEEVERVLGLPPIVVDEPEIDRP